MTIEMNPLEQLKKFMIGRSCWEVKSWELQHANDDDRVSIFLIDRPEFFLPSYSTVFQLFYVMIVCRWWTSLFLNFDSIFRDNNFFFSFTHSISFDVFHNNKQSSFSPTPKLLHYLAKIDKKSASRSQIIFLLNFHEIMMTTI